MNTIPQMPPFHLAFPVTNLAATQAFYGGVLGCPLGRQAERWIDFNFFGHQITAHLAEELPVVSTNPVDGHAIPTSHFGAVLAWDHWHQLAERLKTAQVEFLLEPCIRFAGQVGEQATLFVRDPSGHALEFKAFRNPDQLFATAESQSQEPPCQHTA